MESLYVHPLLHYPDLQADPKKIVVACEEVFYEIAFEKREPDAVVVSEKLVLEVAAVRFLEAFPQLAPVTPFALSEEPKSSSSTLPVLCDCRDRCRDSPTIGGFRLT